MMKGEIIHLLAPISSIAVTHSQLPGCTTIAQPIISELVTIFDVSATSIINLVSSKL